MSGLLTVRPTPRLRAGALLRQAINARRVINSRHQMGPRGDHAASRPSRGRSLQRRLGFVTRPCENNSSRSRAGGSMKRLAYVLAFVLLTGGVWRAAESYRTTHPVSGREITVPGQQGPN